MARAEINLDQADKYTDSQLDSIVAHLDYVYRKAYKEMKEKRDDCFSSFLKASKKKRELVENGDWTEEQYKQWELGWINQSNKMTSLINDYARKATEANQIASDYINDKTPEIFAYNHNFTAYEFEKNTGISFSIIDKNVVKELATGQNHTEFRTLSVNKKATYNWNKEKIQRELTAGIIQGKSIPKIANDFYKIMGSNKKASVRNARTAVTSAQNGGRQQGFNQAQALGINFKKKWLSAHDSRVRDSHSALDGEMVEPDEAFSNGLMYPSDPNGAPSEVYNCRCTMRAVIEKAKKTNVGSFELWEDGKKNGSFIKSVINSAKYLYDAFSNGDVYKNMPSTMKSNFENGLKIADPAISRAIKRYRNDINYVYGYSKNFNMFGTVFLKSDAEGGSIAHEIMHKIDEINNFVSDELKGPLLDDKNRLEKLADSYNITVEELVRASFPDAFEYDGNIKKEYRGISDILNGLCGIELGYGHKKGYWDKSKNMLEKESLAQYARTRYDNLRKVNDMFISLLPKTFKKSQKLVDKV